MTARDPLLRDLDAALRLEPSPAFRAQVRARLAAESIGSRRSLLTASASGWLMAGLGGAAAAAVIALALTGSPVAPISPPSPAALLAARDTAAWSSLPAAVPVQSAHVSSSPAAAAIRPAVLVPPDEIAALQRLLAAPMIAAELPPAKRGDLIIPELIVAPIKLSALSDGESR